MKNDLTVEQWREYDIPGRDKPYHIDCPTEIQYRENGSTHRVVDNQGIVHCVPAPGVKGCVLRWKPLDAGQPVAF